MMKLYKRNRRLFYFFLSIYFSLSGYYSIYSQQLFNPSLSERIASYDMTARLNPVKKTIAGTETLYWKNTSTDKINELQFHLYLNAFKNTKSTFITESGGQLRGDEMDVDSDINWGWIDVTSLKIKDGEDLTGKIKFIHPDDNNNDDQTVISVPLIKPVLPGQTITLLINFNSKLPKVFARSGFSDNYFLAGQWFPKIGVYEKAGERYAVKGGWNCHQYHANSEFYADFGAYNVDITVPKNYKVGAVGVQQNEKQNSDGTKTLTFHAEDVIDFAWTAAPRFKIAEAKWKNVKIKVLLQPEHYSQADKHINSVINALEYFDKYLGKYPYPNVTIVDPPMRASGSAGMEYPTFFTAGCMWGMPSGIKFTEVVVVHEFGHNYFMGMLATNEFEEAWMDEGFNTYYETRIMDNYYGKNTSGINLFGLRMGDGEFLRDNYTGMRNPKIAPDFQYSWQYTNGGYSDITYSKTSTWMHTLEGLLGQKVMDEVMKTYFERWKFNHPCGKDFIAVVNEVVHKEFGDKFGENMDWFFDEVLYGTNVCDYKLDWIDVRRAEQPRGVYDSASSKIYYKFADGKNSKSIYKSKIVISRLGEITLPVDIMVHFDNGEEVIETWDGKDRMHTLIYNRPEKVVWARVDPFNKISMDINRINNSYTTEPKDTVINKYFVKFLFWVENIMLAIGTFF
jgi:hypothetical protein